MDSDIRTLGPRWVWVEKRPLITVGPQPWVTEGKQFAAPVCTAVPRIHSRQHRFLCSVSSPRDPGGVPCASWVFIALSAQQYGLYSAFMGCFVYFFLGTSRDVTLGPTAIMSLLVSFYTFHEPAYAVLLAFLSGCIQLGMGFLRLGKTLRPSCHEGGGLQFSWGCHAFSSSFFAFQGLSQCGGVCVSKEG